MAILGLLCDGAVVWSQASPLGKGHVPESLSSDVRQPIMLAASPSVARGLGVPDSEHVFYQALGLIRKYYGERGLRTAAFQRALNRLSLVVLPQCLEAGVALGPEEMDPEKWFVASLESYCARCGIDSDRALLKALDMLLADLDPMSGLLGPDMLRELRIATSGTFGGIGVVVSPKDGEYVVISAFEGSPAEDAGIRSGDTILEIDGDPIGDLPVAEVLLKVRGRKGTRIFLTVKCRDTGKINHLKLRRRTIQVPPVQYAHLGRRVGYLRVLNFQQETSKAVNRALRKLYGRSRDGLEGLIVDLRNNPGGLFDQAIKVADLFLDKQVITRIRGADGKTSRDFIASVRGTFPAIPLVVLVNRGTASASEILAAALKQRSDVFIMGEPTFGKASVQGIFLLGNGRALRLTTAHYYTPEGRDIDGIGIEPEVRIRKSAEAASSGRSDVSGINRLRTDEGIRAALAFLRGPRSPFSSLY